MDIYLYKNLKRNEAENHDTGLFLYRVVLEVAG
jgi:hypothetical protein